MSPGNSRHSLFLADCEGCPHTVILALPGDEDWGYCVECKDEGFPLTERAAYGDFECGTCHDTGMVPADMTGRTITHHDGTTSFVELAHFADGRCPDCGDGADAAVRAGAMMAGDAG